MPTPSNPIKFRLRAFIRRAELLLFMSLLLAMAACGVSDTPSAAAPTMPVPAAAPTMPVPAADLATVTVTPQSVQTSILWIDHCDPRTAPDHCKEGNGQELTPFYTVIRELPATITYTVTASIDDLRHYDVVIANFCNDVLLSTTVDTLRRYLDNGGSVIAMGDNTCGRGEGVGWHSAAQDATKFTRPFGITFTDDDDQHPHIADTLEDHPITSKVNRIVEFRNAYLRVRSPAQSVVAMGRSSFIALYDGPGTLVAIGSVGFHWDFGAYVPEMKDTDNFVLWRNLLRWLIEQTHAKRS